VLFALPLLLGNVVQQAYSFTDSAVVGRLLGVDAFAAVGATGSIQFLLLGFTWGACAGVAIPVSRAFGGGDMPAMRRLVAAGGYVSLGVTTIVATIGLIGAEPLLRLLGTPPELIGLSRTFLVVTFCGAAPVVAFNYLSSVIRALGDSRTPLVFLVAACVLNAGLVVLFVGALRLGVGGAALATVVAQLVSVVLCFALVARRMPEIHLHRPDWRPRRAEVTEALRSGLPIGFQMSVIAVGGLVLQRAVNGLGAVAVAAFAASLRVDQMAVAPLGSLGLALATFAAQNRGARQWLRIRDGVRRTTVVCVATAIVIGATLAASAGPIVGLLVGPGHGDVVALVRQYFDINGGLYAFLALMFVYRNAVQGLGRATAASLSGVGELVMRVAAGLFLVDALGFAGACLAAPLAWVLGLLPVAVSWFVERRRLVEEERLAKIETTTMFLVSE
jgi:putative MATE family efflux protein